LNTRVHITKQHGWDFWILSKHSPWLWGYEVAAECTELFSAGTYFEGWIWRPAGFGKIIAIRRDHTRVIWRVVWNGQRALSVFKGNF
jgi:hypothetical protein